MKHLFICFTKYQLINAINIKENVLKNEVADIVLINYGGVFTDIFSRLEQSNIFENVYLHVSSVDGIEHYIRNLRDGKKGISLINAINNDLHKIYQKFKGKIKGIEYKINCKINGNKEIDFASYNHIWGYVTLPIVLDIVKAVKRNCNCKCLVSGIDEGVGSYTSDALKMYTDYDEICLYEPDAAVYKDVFKPINAIPKIDKQDKRFVSLLNFVFGFNDSEKLDLNKKVIFFDQCYIPMPKYLQKENISWWKRLLFSRNYKKHLIENVQYENQISLFSEIMLCFNPDDVIVKLHPRTNIERIEDYKKYGVGFMPSLQSPWELFCLNCNVGNGIWITLNSSAVHTCDFTIKSEEINKCIYGFLAYSESDSEIENKKFLKWFARKNSNVCIPGNVRDLRKSLKMIKDNM